ncbi:MAG TPA: Gfo/Idh/MocA family oxidoreductase, partial [Pseudomonadales bacterium]|nr:Gfo/Idh/MocA family oxidoreductase [Pseudomonadales bacterium]
MHKVTRLGVIGVGRMGQAHCRIYSNLRSAQLMGVCDANPEQGNRLAQRYEVPFYRDVDELLDHVEAVSLATPTPYHFELAKKCIERGVHVLI